MHDINLIRENPNKFWDDMKKRGVDNGLINALYITDGHWKIYNKSIDNFRSKIKAIGREIRTADDKTALLKEAKELSDTLAILEQEFYVLDNNRKNILLSFPNILQDSVPTGNDENDNKIEKIVGTIKNKDVKEHFDIGTDFNLMNFETAATVSGSRFTYLLGDLAKLERSLAWMMLDHHINAGFLEVSVPEIVKADALFGTGQLPKFKDDLYNVGNDQYLIPTAEVPLTNMFYNQIIDLENPKRMVAYSSCFRQEVGSNGRDQKGIIRQHQFKKVELVSITRQEDSENEHIRMLETAENILKILELPFRRVLLCTGDTGFSSSKTYDLEVYLEGQKRWREISSISNCQDFQARRMNTRYKDKGKNKFVHTLNGSGVAIGRCIVAIMENYQDGGNIVVPNALKNLMGKEVIEKT